MPSHMASGAPMHAATCVTIHDGCAPRKSSRMMTNLSGRDCHTHTMKRVGCDPHVKTSKAATLKRHASRHAMANIEENHDAIEEDAASYNTPYNVYIKEKTRYKQDRDTSRQECH